MNNYLDSNRPRHAANYAEVIPAIDGKIKVVSYNIHFAENINLVVEELGVNESLMNADFICLQEMDGSGTDQIARELGYNYVYYPASVHSHHGKDFGNAILTRWPISESRKILLPHANPKNGQRRNAVKAIIAMEGIDVAAYCVHTETFWLGPKKRDEQIDALIEDISTKDPLVIVAGDFNTLTNYSIDKIKHQFTTIGMQRATDRSGPTVRLSFVNFTLDHIFTRGLQVMHTGIWAGAKASDHFPVWVDLGFNPASDH